MEKRKIIDCDVFCTKDFHFGFDDVVITGNFYSAGVNVSGGMIEAGGDVIFDGPEDATSPRDLPDINLVSVRSMGHVVFNNVHKNVEETFALEGRTIRHTLPILDITPSDDYCS